MGTLLHVLIVASESVISMYYNTTTIKTITTIITTTTNTKTTTTTKATTTKTITTTIPSENCVYDLIVFSQVRDYQPKMLEC